MRFNPNEKDKVEKGDYPFDDMLESYSKSTYAWKPEDIDKIL